jgi:transposase-like protein
MTVGKTRKVHTPEFKARVGLDAVRGIQTINELGVKHCVHPVQVGQWKKEIQERSASLFEGKRGPKPADDQTDSERLYSEIGRLKMEVDWLKKKLAL